MAPPDPLASIVVRALRATEAVALLPALNDVLAAAYHQPDFHGALGRRVTIQPDGFVAAVDEAHGAGRVVGCGTAVAYPDAGYGWLGLIATHPDHERRGIGAAVTTALVAVLEGYGCAAALDASAAGHPLYLRLGFEEAGTTTVLAATTSTPGADPGPDSAEPMTAADLAAVVELDRAATGADRTRLIGCLWSEQPNRALVVRRDGALVGFGFATDWSLAPVIALDDGALRALLDAALRLPFAVAPSVLVPPGSDHGPTLEAFSFRPRRTLVHMQRGVSRLPGRRGCIAGMASLGEG